jgi:hypothetical protein
MEIRKLLVRKEMKLLTLLLTSLLIATASASVYYSLTLQSKTTVSSPAVKFVTATDFPGPGGDLQDSWVRLNVKSYPNVTLTYERAVNISNTDSASRQIRLTPGTPTGDAASNWDYIKFLVYNDAIPGVMQGFLNYTGGGSWTNTGQTSWMTIDNGVEWTIRVITKSPSSATLTAVCNIVVSLDVQ